MGCRAAATAPHSYDCRLPRSGVSRGQGIRHEPGLGYHLVPDALAVLIGEAFRCPRQHVADFVLHIGHDYSGEGFPESQFFGEAVLRVPGNTHDLHTGVELCRPAQRDLTEPDGRTSCGR
jgi:hypothetical protein